MKLQLLRKQIVRREGLDKGLSVVFLHSSGRRVRSDCSGLRRWPYNRAAPGRMSVTEWTRKRFDQIYPGFKRQILLPTGKPVHGATRLASLRAWNP